MKQWIIQWISAHSDLLFVHFSYLCGITVKIRDTVLGNICLSCILLHWKSVSYFCTEAFKYFFYFIICKWTTFHRTRPTNKEKSTQIPWNGNSFHECLLSLWSLLQLEIKSRGLKLWKDLRTIIIGNNKLWLRMAKISVTKIGLFTLGFSVNIIL